MGPRICKELPPAAEVAWFALKPATVPVSISVSWVMGWFLNVFESIRITAPVRSLFFIVP
ncbi:hypothetical protein D3C87_1962070 [compost metagenome]